MSNFVKGLLVPPNCGLVAFSFDTNDGDDPDGIVDPGGCVESAVSSGTGEFTVVLKAPFRLGQLVAHSCSTDDLTIKAVVSSYTASTGTIVITEGVDDDDIAAADSDDKKISVWLFGTVGGTGFNV